MIHYSHLGADQEKSGATKLVIVLEDPEKDSGTIAPEDLPLRRWGGTRPPFRHSFFNGARRWVKRFLIQDDRITVWLVPRPCRRDRDGQ